MLKLNNNLKKSKLLKSNLFNEFRYLYLSSSNRKKHYLFNTSLLSKMYYPIYLYILRKKKKKYNYISLSSHVTRFNKLDGYDIFTVMFFYIRYKKFYDKKFLLYSLKINNCFFLNFFNIK